MSKTTMSILSKLYKYISLYIKKFLVFAKPKTKSTFKFVRKNGQSFIIGLVALPVAVIWGLLLYKWITAPRPAVLHELDKNSSYYFQGSSNLYTVKIGDKKTNEPKVEFSLGKNKSVTFSPASASSGIPAPTEKDNTVTFKNVYPNTDYTYKTIPLGIKEDITIHKANTISVYPFYIETNGVTPKYYTTNLAGGVFYDEGGNYLFNFEKPFAVDAKGVKTDKVGITIKKDIKTAKLVGLLTVDADWLKDPARVYPVTIDPTVVHDTTAEFATGQMNRVVDTGSGSSPNLTTNYQEFPADINTVGLWHMNEASGTTTVSDASGNSNTGTSSSSTNVGAGQFGNARSFNGTSDNISMAASTNVNITGDISVELWIKPTSFAVASTPIHKDFQYSFYIDTSGNVSWADSSNWSFASFGATNIGLVTGQWQHLAFTKTGGIVKIYLNGVEKASKSFGGAITSTANVMHIGCYYSGAACSAYYNGSIDEVRISNIARTPEEIKLDAQRRPYSVYTSEVIDLSKLQSWNSLSWTELGVNTGDGETLKDATSLVAQWNFNETSGTTANNDAEGSSCGSIPANCDGTLTGFASTASQDQAAGTGWTANNRKWGAGGLMFDGTDDYVTIPDSSNFTFTDFSVEFWIKPNKNGTYDSPIGQYDNGTGATGDWWNFERPAGTTISFKVDDDTAVTSADSTTTLVPGNWYHIVGVRDQDSTLKIYINGKEEGSVAETAYTIDSSQSVYIGNQYANSRYFNGTIDSTRIYSRTLTASEILSNYQAGNIELQTRVGSSTNADDGTWEEWRPVTGETAIASMDTDAANWAWDSSATYMPQLKSNESNIKMEGSGSLKQIIGQPQADANTVGLWHLDETGGTGAYLKDSTANANNGTPTGTTVANGFSGKARSFNGSESISLGNTSITDNATNLTVDAWVYTTTSDATHHRVFSEENVLYVGQYSNQVSLYMGNGSSWTNTSITMGTLTPNAWHHLAWVKSGTIANVYIDGVFSATITAPASLGTTSNINTIGTNDGGVQKWIGKLDEIRISNVARSSEEIAEAYRAGRDHYLNKTISSTDLFGKTSLPFYVASDRQGTFLNAVIGESAFANYQPDANTAGLWHLDENNSEAVYNYTGTDQTYTVPTGVTSINVKTWGGGGGGGNPGGWTYGFPGGGGGYTTGNISVTPGQVLTVAVGAGGTNGSIANQNPNYGGGARSCNTGSDCRYGGQGGGRSSIWYNGGDLMTAGGGGGGGSSRATNGEQGGAGGGNVGVAGTSYTAGYGGGGGTQSAGGTAGTGASAGTQYAGGNPASNAYGGSGGGGWYGGGGGGYLEPNDMGGGGGGSGYIGGTGVSGGVTTAGSGTTPGNSTDIARGTAGLGGAISTNGNPGKVIISYSYLKDSSGNGNHGTPVGTTFTQGKIGKARSFDGTSEYISIPHSTTLKPASQISISAWVRPTTGSLTALREIYRKEDGTDRHLLAFQPAANCASGVGCIAFGISTGGVYTEAEVNVVATDWENAWHYVVVTYDGSNKKIYKDGVLIGSIAATGAIGTTGTAASIIGSASGTGEFFSGLIDEVTVSNIARTADQIRQAYEIGARTYNITIDFKAALNSGNLIANISDLGFTIDATAYGASAMGSNLFLGDKIIVKENYDGTEYIAQGTVNSLNTSTGAVTVAAWDSGSTVPSGGFTVNATVFKWQREYFDIRGSRCTADTDADCDRYAVTNLTLRVTDGSQGSTVWLDDFRSNDGYLTTPAGSTIMSSTGDRYFQYRAIPVSYDTAVSPSLTSVTLDYTPNVAPNTPSLDLPADTTTGQSLTPVLKTTTTDTDLDNIQYKIQICTDLAMTLNCQTFDQTSSQTGWSGQNYPPGGPYTAYTSGAQGVYTVQTALDAGTTYYWRSYAIDPAGINTWSSTQTTPYSFTTTQPPSAPTLLLTQGLTNPTGVATLTPYFSAIHNDSEGDSANYYQIQVNTASDFSGTSMWDSGKTGMTLTANAARSPDITYAGSVPSWAATYYWRIKFWDTFGVGGAYSSAAQFTMDVASNAPTLDLPTNGATDQGLLTVFKTTATDPDSDYLRYKIQICTDLAMTLNCQTFDQTSSQTGWSGQDYPPGGPYTAYASATQAVYTIQTGLSPLTTYFWRSYAIDPAGTNTWGSTQTPYSFTTTNAPLAATSCRILETPDDTLLTVVWTDNATNEDNYEVQRSVDGANFSVLHTSLAAGTVSDVDSTVSDGHTYQYRVAPYLTAGPIYGGWCVTPMLSLQLGTFSIKGLDLKGLNLH